jgi:hypothetical protein
MCLLGAYRDRIGASRVVSAKINAGRGSTRAERTASLGGIGALLTQVHLFFTVVETRVNSVAKVLLI